MKKLLSASIVAATVFAFTAFGNPPVTCVDGHLNSTGFCVAGNPGELNHGSRNATDEPTLTFIQTLIAEYNPFIFFLN